MATDVAARGLDIPKAPSGERFRVLDLGLRGLVFRVQRLRCSGLGVLGLGFRV